MLICHSYIFVEVCVLSFWPLLKKIDCFLFIEIWEFFIYCGIRFYIRYIFCKCQWFLNFCATLDCSCWELYYKHIPGPTRYQLNLLDMVPGICSFYTQIIQLDLHNGHLQYTDWEYCGHPSAGILPTLISQVFTVATHFFVSVQEWAAFFPFLVVEICSSKVGVCMLWTMDQCSLSITCFHTLGELRMGFIFFNDWKKRRKVWWHENAMKLVFQFLKVKFYWNKTVLVVYIWPVAVFTLSRLRWVIVAGTYDRQSLTFLLSGTF